MSLESMARIVASKAHRNQSDRAGVPYIKHPETVAAMVTTDEEKAVAYLHDVIEDTPLTLEDLKKQGFPSTVINAVALLTKQKGQSYQDYLEGVKENALARKVKLADLKHNSDLTRLHVVTDADIKRYEKYQEAIAYLST